MSVRKSHISQQGASSGPGKHEAMPLIRMWIGISKDPRSGEVPMQITPHEILIVTLAWFSDYPHAPHFHGNSQIDISHILPLYSTTYIYILHGMLISLDFADQNILNYASLSLANFLPHICHFQWNIGHWILWCLFNGYGVSLKLILVV